jgi:hypothetical protein
VLALSGPIVRVCSVPGEAGLIPATDVADAKLPSLMGAVE